MSLKKEIEALREEIKEKEGQLYRANLEANAWSKGKNISHSNARMTKIFVESSRKEIAELNAKLKKLERKKS
ncbi:hypothetical protein ACFL07_06145 [Pseudomonadota bacterium]